jgi:transposase
MGKQFTREFKIETVRLSYQTDMRLDEFAASVGISRSSLNRWRREYGQDSVQAFPGKGVRKERDEEVARLKKQLRDAQLENEILKKAVAIFTQPKR